MYKAVQSSIFQIECHGHGNEMEVIIAQHTVFVPL